MSEGDGNDVETPAEELLLVFDIGTVAAAVELAKTPKMIIMRDLRWNLLARPLLLLKLVVSRMTVHGLPSM